ncbi:hypothetical protein ACKVMT_10455 [Halobacteriales archaeon Cl-PHB]
MSTRTLGPFLPGWPVGSSARGFLEALAFWTAVVLPFSYVPLLAQPETSPQLLAALLVANIACLLVGHDYAGR